MKIVRFIVSAAFAWMLIRATFANTAGLRHHSAAPSARAYKAVSRSVAAERIGPRVRT